MTGHQINSLVGDLVAMAQAMEQLPIAQADLRDAQSALAASMDKVADREESILRLKAEAETLHSRIRTLEAERDDAELRFLECDDRLAAFRRLVQSFSTDAVSLIAAAEPTAMPESIPNVNEPEPMGNHLSNDDHVQPTAQPEGVSVQAGESIGTISSAPPTTGTSENVHSSNAESSTTASSDAASPPDVPPSGPYSGRKYSEVTDEIGKRNSEKPWKDRESYPTRSDWRAGGGTEDGWWS